MEINIKLDSETETLLKELIHNLECLKNSHDEHVELFISRKIKEHIYKIVSEDDEVVSRLG